MTFAVNYEVTMVNQFLASTLKRKLPSHVDSVQESTGDYSPLVPSPLPTTRRTISNLENSAPNVPEDIKDKKILPQEQQPPPLIQGPQVTIQSPAPTLVVNEQRRRSTRSKEKREAPLARARVRYDMQLVPPARRHRLFLNQYPQWWLPQEEEKRGVGTKSLRSSVRNTTITTTCTKNNNMTTDENYPPGQSLSPFEEDTSVVWIPSKRPEWEDSIGEMTAVCTSAALRRHIVTQSRSTTKPFHAPLSRDYIRDRMDIDDPLNGYQIRHKSGGWLQGFVTWTNFTTWTHYFSWDSRHPMSGIPSANAEAFKLDKDGSLTAELEVQPRSGDPMGGGIVTPTIAEIGLLGGLGCGEYLLRMALEMIISKKQYKYVVLQATDSSRFFYERFGFIRVGAVCKYLSPLDLKQEKAEVPLMGYRHWTHCNESERSLKLHGGPSYMMCLKLPDSNGVRLSEETRKPSLLQAMLQLEVNDKPKVEQLGAISTPGPKAVASRRYSTSSIPIAVNEHYENTPKKRGRKPYRRSSGVHARRKGTPISPLLTPLAVTIPNGVPSTVGTVVGSNTKRRRTSYTGATHQNDPSRGATGYNKFVPNHTFGEGSKPKGRRKPIDRSAAKPKKKPLRKNAARGARMKSTPMPELPDALFSPPSIKSGSVDKEVKERKGKPIKIDKSTLKKQKVRSYPRSRVHYFNRVVKRKRGSKQFYFVLHYDESKVTIKIVPMLARGLLTGKREGRPRYQAVVGPTDCNFLTAKASDFVVVPATMVMKTPIVAAEAWDIEE